MADDIDAIINQVNQLDDPAQRKNALPDDALIARYEAFTGFRFTDDYKKFLKSVSNAFVGFLSPLTLNEEMGGVYGELRSAIAEGRAIGLPQDWLPICEDNGDYYCITPDSKVRFWDHNGSTGEEWSDLATWAKEVWLGGG